jgi:hypothetical protein
VHYEKVFTIKIKITIPDRLYDKMSDLMPKSLIIMEQREGVGENKEQFTIRKSISLGERLVALSKFLTQSFITN